MLDANAKKKAREALVAKFVSDWGFQNTAENAEFQRDLRELIRNWDGLSEPSQNGAPKAQSVPTMMQAFRKSVVG